MDFRVDRILACIDVPLFWSSVKRRLPLLLGAMVASGVLAYFVMSFVTPRYNAVARIQFIPDEKSGQLPDSRKLQIQAAAIFNDNFLKNIIQTLNLQTHPEFVAAERNGNDAVEEIKSRLRISWQNAGSALNIRFFSSDPVLAYEATNAVASAFLVLSGEQTSGLNARLTMRAVVPLSPEYPRKGPVALLVMSLAGLGMLGYLLARNIVLHLAVRTELALDEKHHQLDVDIREFGKNHALMDRQMPFDGSRSGPAFRGIYSWQPEESIEDVVKQLGSLQVHGRPFRILVCAETAGINVAADTLQIARAFASGGRPTLLVDAGDMENGVSKVLDLREAKGFCDVIRNPALLEEIVNNDPESSLHVVARGRNRELERDEESIGNLLKIFSAWSAVYEVVIVCSSYRNAAELYESLDESFEAGVFVQKEGIAANDTVSRNFADRMDGFDLLFYRQRADRKQDEQNRGGIRSSAVVASAS